MKKNGKVIYSKRRDNNKGKRCRCHALGNQNSKLKCISKSNRPTYEKDVNREKESIQFVIDLKPNHVNTE